MFSEDNTTKFEVFFLFIFLYLYLIFMYNFLDYDRVKLVYFQEFSLADVF